MTHVPGVQRGLDGLRHMLRPRGEMQQGLGRGRPVDRTAEQDAPQQLGARRAAGFAGAQDGYTRFASASASRSDWVVLPAPSPPSSVMKRPSGKPPSANAHVPVTYSTKPPSRVPANQAGAHPTPPSVARPDEERLRRSPSTCPACRLWRPAPSGAVEGNPHRGLLPPVSRHRHGHVMTGHERHRVLRAKPDRNLLDGVAQR